MNTGAAYVLPAPTSTGGGGEQLPIVWNLREEDWEGKDQLLLHIDEHSRQQQQQLLQDVRYEGGAGRGRHGTLLLSSDAATSSADDT